MEEGQSLQQMVLGKPSSYMQKKRLHYYLIPNTKVNPKWIKDLNGRSETIKVLEENIGSNFTGISICDVFVDLTLKTREKNKQVGLH